MKNIFTLFFSFLIALQLNAQLKSPDEFLPHKLGEHFTPHHYLVDYYYHVAEESPLVEVRQYGLTNLERPLITAFVSSDKNLARLEDIRKYNLKLAGIEDNNIRLEDTIAIVWLSFSVHGNEAAGSESSYQVLYDLADPSNAETKKWLENTVVILDPSINPDGYSRYTHWVRNFAGKKPNPDINDIEHREPWPGGRTNYYFFDLNRDWAWQTQVESQQRMKLYNSWLPQVHADLHEMGYTSPYYFAPAAEPYHKFITDWQRDFQVAIGKNHAKYFDRHGWLYFTKEVFDLFYPSYGDTYPVYNGAIGMTYEQGGGGRGGRKIKMPNEEFLSLKDRIDHHKTTALSTIETSSIHAGALIRHFESYFINSMSNPPGQYKTYVVKTDKTRQRLKAFCKILNRQGIQYTAIDKITRSNGLDYSTGETSDFEITPEDVIISAFQPKAVITQVLMDPESQLVDSLTYDITAWSLPYAYGLKAFALENRLEGNRPVEFEKKAKELAPDSYAYAFHWESLTHARALSKLLKKGITARVAMKEIKISGKHFPLGTILITKADNRSKFPNLSKSIDSVLADVDIEIFSISTGFSDDGPDLGSRSMSILSRPKILTVLGDNVRSNDYGQVKYFFEQELNLTITSVEAAQINNLDLDSYTCLVLPNGRFRFSKELLDKISSWIRGGGKLIALGGALNSFVDQEGFALMKYATKDEKTQAEKEEEKIALETRLDPFEGSDRRRISGQVPGAIVKVEMDQTNPLAFGIGKDYFSLRTGSMYFPLMKTGWNVAHIPEDPLVMGFMGSDIRKKLEKTVVFGVEEKGAGAIVYMVDNPLFRGFWDQGKFLFANAVYLAGK